MYSYYVERFEILKMEKIRRSRIVKKQKLCLCAFIIIIVLVGSIFTCNKLAFANSSKTNTARAKYYKSITIYSGDTLWSIANEYKTDEWNTLNTYIHEVKTINHISNDDVLIPGNYITIPYYSDVIN